MQELVMNQGMIASAVVLAVTFIGIFTEQIHGMERSKVSSAGAVAMVIVGQIYGFYEPMAAVEAVDWNVIFLLAAMMTVVSIMIPTGGFGWMAYKLAVFSKGRLYLMLVLLGTAVTVLSLVLVAQAQKVNPIPYLLAAALLSDTGGVGTLVGDPPNLMIGSAADISFNTFAIRMGPPVFVCWLLVLVMLRFLFHKQLSEKPEPIRSCGGLRSSCSS